MSSLPPLSTRTAQPSAPLPSGLVQPSAFRLSPSAFDATSSRKPWRPSGPASAGSTAPLPSGLVQPSSFRLSPSAFDATSSRKPWRPSGPASAGSTAPLPSGLVQPLAFILSALLLLAFPSGASAATATNTNNSLGWDTNSTGWDTVTGNAWDSSNGGTNTAVFTNASGSIQVVNPITIGGLTYSPAGTFSIWGSQINLGAASTFNVANAASALTVSNVIAGSSGLTKSGSGTLILTGSNSYTGTTLVNNGGNTLQLGNGGTTGSLAGSGTINLNGTTLRINRSDSVTQGIDFGTLIGSANNSSGFVQAGTGTTTLMANTNFNPGATTEAVFMVSAGTLRFGTNQVVNASSISGNFGNSVRVTNTGTLDVGSFSNKVRNLSLNGGNIIGTGTLDVYVSGDLRNTGISTISASIAGTGNWQKNTDGSTVIFTGSNSYTGTMTIWGGFVNIQNNNALGSTSGGTTVSGGNAALQLQGGITVGSETLTLAHSNAAGSLRNISGTNTYGGPIILTANSRINSDADLLIITGGITGVTRALTVGGSGNTTINSAIATTTGTLTKDGTGILTLSGINTYTGTTTVSAGILSIATTDALPGWSTSGRYSVANGGTLAVYNAITDANVTTMVYGTTNFAVGSAIGFDTTSGNRDYSLVLSNTSRGALGLTKAGANTLTLTAANTYTGGTTIRGGTLAISNNAAMGTGAVTVASSSTVAALANLTVTNAYVISSAVNATFDSGANTWTNSGVMSGAGSLTKAGAGTLTLTASNSYTGTTTVNGGQLTLGNTNALSGSTFAGGTGNLSFGSLTNARFGGLGASTDLSLTNANGNAVSLTVGANNTTTTNSGIISGSGSLTKSGTGALTLSGINTYTGTTTVSAGILSIATTDALPGWSTSGRYSVASGSTLAVYNAITDANVTTMVYGTTNFAVGSAIGFDTTSGNRDYSLVLSNTSRGNLGLTKTGANTLTLTATNTYTGATTVNAGTLAYGTNNAIANTSAVTINGGTFDIGSFSDTVGAVTLGGGTITGTTGVLTGSSYTVNNGSGVTVISANIGGAGGLNKFGTSTLTLSGSNSFTGYVKLENSGVSTLNINNNNALGTGTLSLNNSQFGNTSGSLVTVTNTIALDSQSVTWTGGDLVGKVFQFNTTTGSAGLSVNSGNLTFDRIDAKSANSASFTKSLSTNAWITINQAAGNNITSVGIGTDSGSVRWNFLLGSGGAFGTGTISAGQPFTIQGSQDLTGTNAFNNSWFLLSGNGGQGYQFSGSNSIALNNTLSASNAQNQQIINNISSGKTLTLTNVNLNIMTNATAVTFSGSGDTVITGTVSNSGSNSTLIYTGNSTLSTNLGSLTLMGSNTYRGNTTVSAGTLRVGNDNALGTGTLGLYGGALSASDSVTARTLTNNFIVGANISLGDSVNNAALTFNGTGNLGTTTRTLTINSAVTFAGALTNTAGITKDGTGILTLSGINTYTGTTTVSAGILSIATTNALPGWSTSGRYSVANGGTLAVYNAITDANVTTMVYGTTNFASGSAIGFDTTTANRDYSLVLSNTAQGALGLTKTGANTLTLTAANTYTGTTTVNAGTLVASNASALGASSGAITASGGTLDLGGNGFLRTGLVTFSGGTVTNGTITNNTATNFNAQSGNVAAILAGSAGLTKSGTGTLSLTAANTYSGTTTVNEGTLQLGDGGSAGSLSASSAIVNNATIVINRSNSVTQGTDFSSAAITGTGSLTQAGTGTLSLTAANTYSGTTTVNGGTLQLGNGGSTGSLSASSAIVNNGTFAINRSNSVTQGTDFSGAAITGTGSFTQAGTGTTTLNAANTYSGTTTVNSGTLVASNESALGASSGAITASGGTLDLGGNGFLRTGLVTISGGTVTNGTITNNTATNFDAQSGNVAAILAGSAGLTKSGAGTLSLSGANTYTGTTTVDEGTLSLGTSGSLTATTSVTVTNGATLLLGSSAPNRINANAALNLGGGQLSMGAAGTGGSRASSQTFASLTLTANSSINFANLTGTSSLYFSDIIGLSSERTLSIFNYNGASSSTGGVGQFTKLYAATSSTSGFSANLGNILFYSGGDTSSLLGSASFGGTMGAFTEITDIVPVPEPSVVIAALMLLAWLLYTNRGAMRRLIGC